MLKHVSELRPSTDVFVETLTNVNGRKITVPNQIVTRKTIKQLIQAGYSHADIIGRHRSARESSYVLLPRKPLSPAERRSAILGMKT